MTDIDATQRKAKKALDALCEEHSRFMVHYGNEMKETKRLKAELNKANDLLEQMLESFSWVQDHEDVKQAVRAHLGLVKA